MIGELDRVMQAVAYERETQDRQWGGPRCYRKREWEVVHLPPEAARGLEVARDRTRSLVHDLSGRPIEDMLVAAYLQGVVDGDQVHARSPKRSSPSA